MRLEFIYFLTLFFSERIIPELLQVLCSEDLTPKEHLENQQALFKQFAEILDFVLKFDELKVCDRVYSHFVFIIEAYTHYFQSFLFHILIFTPHYLSKFSQIKEKHNCGFYL